MAAVGSTVKVLRALSKWSENCPLPYDLHLSGWRYRIEYLLCQHVWESAGHACLFGNEGTSWAVSEDQAAEKKLGFIEESIRVDEEIENWPLSTGLSNRASELVSKVLGHNAFASRLACRKLVAEFIQDEERHQAEIQPYTGLVENTDWVQRLQLALDFQGGWLGPYQKRNCRTISMAWPDLPYRHRTPVIEATFPNVPAFLDTIPGVSLCRDWLEGSENRCPRHPADGLCVADDGARRG